MRRALLLPAAVLLAAAGCGSSGEAEPAAAPPSEAPAKSGLLSAQDVVDHFEAEGIGTPEARDTSHGCTEAELCDTRVTTMLVSVYALESVELAEAQAAKVDGTHQAGNIVLWYIDSSASEERIAEYNAALDELVAQQG